MTLTDTDEPCPMEGVVAKKEKSLSREELKALIEVVAQEPYNLGDKWFVVCITWWNRVIQAADKGYPDDIPAIDCSRISVKADNGRYYLKARLSEGVDFTVLPSKVFGRLRDAYGIQDDVRDHIERTVVSKGNQIVVEIYPRCVEVSLARDTSKKATFQLTSADTMSSVRERVLKELDISFIPPENIRFYIVLDNKYELIDDTQNNIDAYFDTTQKVVVDVKDEESTWFINNNTSNGQNGNKEGTVSLFGSGSIAGSYGTSSYERERANNYIKGVCGLQNLGNTCFMASALQCLSNVPALTDYFYSKEYEKDINEKNPLGTHGELARSYGDLIHMLWSGQNNSVQPRKLKTTIGQFAPRFSGYSQQDSQELLAYLLDGLHEDLNRIKQKPYVEEDENMEKLEEHLQAEKGWQNYRSRNDSIIVDKFHGQLKSTLVCPVCAKVSIKFDPFCFLSVPLPAKDKPGKQMITVMRQLTEEGQKSKWAKFSMAVSRSTTVLEAVNIMSHSMSINPLNVVLFVVGEANDDVQILEPNDTVLVDDRNRELFAAQVDHNPYTSKLLVVKNQQISGRPVSIPMIFSAKSIEDFNKEFITDKVLPFTRTMFQSPTASSSQDTDDSMTGGEREDPYKIFMVPKNSSTYVPVEDESSLNLPNEPVNTLIFQWNEPKLFNGYRGKDLIEREVTVSQKKDVQLTDCIDLFTKTEQLGEDDSWYCPQCKKHEKASKKLDLWKLPEVLIIHLKRFQYSRWNRDKIDTPVVIPVRGFELNSKLANERHEHVKYDLIAMSHHMGGLGGGHYTAAALNKTTNKWYDFNDAVASVATPPPDPLIGKTPYMLVYCRRDPTPDGAHADSNFEMETDQ